VNLCRPAAGEEMGLLLQPLVLAVVVVALFDGWEQNKTLILEVKI
jgi:hypothetical protein